VLTGANLPMLLKFSGCRSDFPLAELAVLLKGYGQQGIVLASELLQKPPVTPT
jgi:mannose/fructose-specific phosphotransferase system component IIA